LHNQKDASGRRGREIAAEQMALLNCGALISARFQFQ
jgi:hypothetical protein